MERTWKPSMNAPTVAQPGPKDQGPRAVIGAEAFTSPGQTSMSGSSARAARSAILSDFHSRCTDWRVRCSGCGQWRYGSLAELRVPHGC